MNQPNPLYFGDWLDVMRAYIKDESVDLIYLDPPFNSKRPYNPFILDTHSRWEAFDDTWQCYEAIGDYHKAGGRLSYGKLIDGLYSVLGEGPRIAYFSYMANRLIECRRVLKSSSSIYRHCDPTISHYLKVLMDGIFGDGLFHTEINWQRTYAHNDSMTFGTVSDKILFYGDEAVNVDANRMPLDPAYIKSHYSANPESTDGMREGWANWDEGAYKGDSLGSIGTDVTRQRVFSSRAGLGERSMEAGNRVIVRSAAAGCTRGPGGREFGGVGSVADGSVKLGVGWLAAVSGRG